jgi:hypothetical protein
MARCCEHENYGEILSSRIISSLSRTPLHGLSHLISSSRVRIIIFWNGQVMHVLTARSFVLCIILGGCRNTCLVKTPYRGSPS